MSPLQKIPLGPGYQVPFAQAIREATGLTTIAVGLITEAKQAEEIVASGKADMVALARAMLYDPRWGWHAAAELGGEVFAPPQYWRSQPSTQKALFGATTFGTGSGIRRSSARHSAARTSAQPFRHISATRVACYALACARQTRFEKMNSERTPHGDRIFHDAVPSAGVRVERGSRLGPADAALAR